MDEDMSVDTYRTEFDNEDPQIMKPQAFVLVIDGNPALNGGQHLDSEQPFPQLTHPPARPK